MVKCHDKEFLLFPKVPVLFLKMNLIVVALLDIGLFQDVEKEVLSWQPYGAALVFVEFQLEIEGPLVSPHLLRLQLLHNLLLNVPAVTMHGGIVANTVEEGVLQKL